jgi:hypothetical protein
LAIVDSDKRLGLKLFPQLLSQHQVLMTSHFLKVLKQSSLFKHTPQTIHSPRASPNTFNTYSHSSSLVQSIIHPPFYPLKHEIQSNGTANLSKTSS